MRFCLSYFFQVHFFIFSTFFSASVKQIATYIREVLNTGPPILFHSPCILAISLVVANLSRKIFCHNYLKQFVAVVLRMAGWLLHLFIVPSRSISPYRRDFSASSVCGLKKSDRFCCKMRHCVSVLGGCTWMQCFFFVFFWVSFG